MWRSLVENTWLALHVIYRGKRRKSLYGNGNWDDRAYGFFMRNMVGNGLFTLTKMGWYYRICFYLNDLYPDLLSRNPFEEPEYFEFPYKTVTIDHMYLVYQMTDRFSLLRIAEERGMKYDEFFDYVVNHIYSENEPLTKPKYKLMHYEVMGKPSYVSEKGFNAAEKKKINTPRKFTYKVHG